MHKLIASTYKEFLLLIRDPGGIAILFIMPLVLLVTITLIQDSTFKTVSDTSIPVLVVNKDSGHVSEDILKGLKTSGAFEIVYKNSEETARSLVFSGDYQLAVIIPEQLTSGLEERVNRNVNGIMARMGFAENDSIPSNNISPREVKLYFDPAVQQSFKGNIKNGIDKMISRIETAAIYRTFQQQLSDDPGEKLFDTESFITFREILPGNEGRKYIPNSVQHNVPAWSLFAIFFIIVPLSINIVKEKGQGTFVRLRIQPVSYATVLGGKTITYLAVCLIQFSLMLLVGIYLFPRLGLSRLDVSGRLPLLLVVTFFAGLAAIGLGLLLGTIARTQEQSAPFGATLVVILAALGGVWVPVFIMPEIMQALSHISPMNWGLNAFYDVFLRNASFSDILPEIALLFLFFAITTVTAVIYNEKKNAV